MSLWFPGIWVFAGTNPDCLKGCNCSNQSQRKYFFFFTCMYPFHLSSTIQFYTIFNLNILFKNTWHAFLTNKHTEHHCCISPELITVVLLKIKGLFPVVVFIDFFCCSLCRVKPSLIEYLSYNLNFLSILVGPCSNYKDYIDFIEGRHVSQRLRQHSGTCNGQNGYDKTPDPSPLVRSR